MAIEARFRITDPGVFWSLQTIDHLANYDLSTQQIRMINDAYLETNKRDLLAAGYICRRREQDVNTLITLTKLESLQNSIRKPEMWEVSLENAKNNPANWPDSQVRARVIEAAKHKVLRTIFSVNQTRIIRIVRKDGQVIGQANLDSVSLKINKKEQHLKTLKLKIGFPDPEIHLKTLIASLHKKWDLELDTRTKYDHVMSME